jgi:hypothetical protein
MSNPSNFINVLSSPSVWTGKAGVTSVTNLLTNPALQDGIQLGLVKSSYATLVQTGQIVVPTGLMSTVASISGLAGTAKFADLPAAGLGAITGLQNSAISSIAGLQNSAISSISGSLLGNAAGISSITGALSGSLGGITGALSGSLGGITGALSGSLGGIADLGGLLATAGKFGVDDAVAWAKGKLPALPDISGLMDSLAKQGQFAVNFSDFKLPAALAGVIPAEGFAGTIDRSTLNAATAKLIGSDKIPLPKFAPESISTAPLIALAGQAKSLLPGISGITNLLPGIPNVSSITGLISGSLPASSLLSSAKNLLSTSQSVLSTASTTATTAAAKFASFV